MKKLWMSLGLIMLIVLLSACGNNENVHENDKVDKMGKSVLLSMEIINVLIVKR